MKKIILLFLFMYTLSFSIVDFDNLRWNDKVFDIMLAYPGVHKEESFQNRIEIYTLDHPTDLVASYKFYLVDGSLYKIETHFDPEQVDTTLKIRDIYDRLTTQFGNPLDKSPINEKLIDTTLKGNSQTFKASNDTFVFFKGVDTYDKDDNMINSELILEYRNNAKMNVYP